MLYASAAGAVDRGGTSNPRESIPFYGCSLPFPLDPVARHGCCYWTCLPSAVVTGIDQEVVGPLRRKPAESLAALSRHQFTRRNTSLSSVAGRSAMLERKPTKWPDAWRGSLRPDRSSLCENSSLLLIS